MPNEQKKCPKCRVDMVQGWVPDFTLGSASVATWHEGEPRKSIWTKTKIPPDEGFPVGAFRCKICGFLEFYAAPQFGLQ